MTGYTVHTGASKDFVEGWDRIFSGGDSKATAGKAAKKKKPASASASKSKAKKAKAKKKKSK